MIAIWIMLLCALACFSPVQSGVLNLSGGRSGHLAGKHGHRPKNTSSLSLSDRGWSAVTSMDAPSGEAFI
ncbi:hypothetical protein PCANC_25876 [Puccinia coronata f. sp. avenae]|uniref:Secreted protein n=1 Tax=Puccinia coronata f. sp. avenae TaxID=200324 RepID=A0A2N5THW1_9BASI|nr:hypothetical protein PCANC_25876 [Puccinia coronata f. sp. avenae]